MKTGILILLACLSLVGCGKDDGKPEEPPNPNLSMALVVDNAEGVGAVLDAKNRDAELARAEMIVRFAK